MRAILFAAAVLALAACGRNDRPATPAGEATLEICPSPADCRSTRLPIAKDATVMDLLQTAEARGFTSATTQGRGETAFVSALDGATGENGAYWLFQINGAYACRGAGVTRIAPGDTVSWRLTAEMAACG